MLEGRLEVALEVDELEADDELEEDVVFDEDEDEVLRADGRELPEERELPLQRLGQISGQEWRE